MSDGTGLTEKLLGLDGFRVLEVLEGPDELVVTIETTAAVMGCSACGTRAVAHERMPIAIRDLACFGRPVRLVWQPLALPGAGLRREDLDRALRSRRRTGRAHPPGRGGGVPPGRRERPAGVERRG